MLAVVNFRRTLRQAKTRKKIFKEEREETKGKERRRRNGGGKEKSQAYPERQPKPTTSHNNTTASLLFLFSRHPLHIARTLFRALIQSRIALTALPLPLEET